MKHLVTSAMIFTIYSCTKAPAPEVVDSAPKPVSVPAPEAIATAIKPEEKPVAKILPPEKKMGLAELKAMSNHVEFRLHDESLWQKAAIEQNFDRFDALQTQENSGAKVRYNSGSQLDIDSSTLIVFDRDPGKNKKEDRIIVKNGELTGSTKTELWVFTNAGLVQIKAPPKTAVLARVKITIPDGKKMNVKVDTGTASVIIPEASKFKTVEMAPHSDLQITAPAQPVDLQKIPEKAVIAKADLVIDSPAEGTSTDLTEITVQGHFTEIGAKLLLNGQPVQIGNDLKFSKKIALTEGANLVVFQMIRTDASTVFQRRNVRRVSHP